jgi:hypothetical protein
MFCVERKSDDSMNAIGRSTSEVWPNCFRVAFAHGLTPDSFASLILAQHTIYRNKQNEGHQQQL